MAVAAVEETPWLTVKEAAGRTKYGDKAIYAAVRAGKLRAVRQGTALRIHVEWLDAWMNQAATVVNEDAPGREIPFRPRRRS